MQCRAWVGTKLGTEDFERLCSRSPPKAANSIKAKEKYGGRDRDRTGDPLLAKQVLSQLSYTPTVGTTYILKHFRGFQNPFLRFSTITVPKLYQNPRLQGLLAPRQGSFRWLGG